jgi:Family of unknown function (DUF6455)
MEGAMPNPDTHQPQFSTVEVVLNAIADWVNKYRNTAGAHAGFGYCGPNEVMQIAKDLGVPVSELREIVRKGPGAADLVQRMLVALKVDAAVLEKASPAVMRDLQRLCVTCGSKKQCEHELANGTAADHFHEFCPNAFTLDALFKHKDDSTRR